MGLTPQDMFVKMKERIAQRTGRDFDAWIAVARQAGIDTHKALTEHMKTVHGLNHNEAQWAAWAVVDPGRMESYDKPKDLVDELYSGKKAALRPIYDAAMAAGLAAAPGVGTNVCKTYTSLAGRVQFAIVVPRVQSAVDLELALPADVASPRLEPLKGSNPRFQHRVRLHAPADVDDEVRALLAAAARAAG